VETSLLEAARGAGVELSRLAVAAVAAPWSEQVVQAVVLRHAPEACVIIAGEDLAALMGGVLEPHGLVLIAGTGSRCAYIPREGGGAPVVAGAWGSLFGDEGSGYDIGRMALRAVTHFWDGRGPWTILAQKLEALWDIRSQKDIVNRVYGADAGGWRFKIASVSALVGQAAAEGDAVAGRILDQAAEGLAAMVDAVVRRSGVERPARVLISGGVFSTGRPLLDRLEKRLKPGGLAFLVLPAYPPVCGALMVAARAAGLEAGAGSRLIGRLESLYRCPGA
jgi:N-acetylglucosamine kinase-like BadF-type ATPase